MIGLLRHGLIIHSFVLCIFILIVVQKKGSLFVGLSFRQIFPDIAIYMSIYNFESQMLQYQKIYSVVFLNMIKQLPYELFVQLFNIKSTFVYSCWNKF